MTMDVESVNQELQALHKVWQKEIMEPFCQEYQNQQYSDSFCTGVIDGNAKKTIMFVGQQANNFFFKEYRKMIKTNQKVDAATSQNWITKYLKIQLGIIKDNKAINRSAFWECIRSFKEEYNIVWNNIDKLHICQYSGEGKKYKTKALSEKEEIALNDTFYFNGTNNTLFLHECDIIKPDIIVFITGPYYNHSMESALQLEAGILKQRPRIGKDKKLENGLITLLNTKYLDKTTLLWTYHPTYLMRIKVLKDIIIKIKKGL